MENLITPYQSVLSIAGSDSGGCAGIQADIKSISACGAYAASVITATTAQNTQGVFDIHAIPIAHIEKQLTAVLDDINFGAIKIGMLHSCHIIELVKSKLAAYKVKNIVIDPVMVATSGDKLITDDAINCLGEFLPDAMLITPNANEAALLIGKPISQHNAESATREIGNTYGTSVLLKGGHIPVSIEDAHGYISDNSEVVDFLFLKETNEIRRIVNPKIDTKNTHGTGCSLSSSIATFLSLEHDLETAVKKGCQYVNHAINNGKNKVLGKGNGPINHFGLK
ncbi:MAG: bifunctional hydroxymethylpyrimidine kinase/phosphomethylpyrimidine kinase [Ostreibacterium sp.]